MFHDIDDNFTNKYIERTIYTYINMYINKNATRKEVIQGGTCMKNH